MPLNDLYDTKLVFLERGLCRLETLNLNSGVLTLRFSL
jgi:hypothetical protein